MSSLALRGGVPLRSRPFPAWPVFDDREIEAATRVLRSGVWWRPRFGEGLVDPELLYRHQDGGGEGSPSEVTLFQQEFADLQGARYAVACSNGTAAVDLAVRALDIGPGAEVIVPAYTYIGGVTGVLHSGAVPVFADIDPETYNLDPARVEEAITDATAAVIPCHFGGQCADLDGLREVCSRRGLRLIEDAAHAHGAAWRGRTAGGAGTIGDLGTFSFQSSKNMTAGEGGMVVTGEAELAARVESLAWSGRRHGHPWYEFHELGWNARLTELQAAVLRVQLTRVREQNARRRENAAVLRGLLAEIEGLEPIRIDPRGDQWSVHIFMIRYDRAAFGGAERGRLLAALDAEGIPASGGYTHPVYRNPMFLQRRFLPPPRAGGEAHDAGGGHAAAGVDYSRYAALCPVAERACGGEALWLEQRLFLGEPEDMEDIAAAFRKIQGHHAELD
ncbi:MAG: DegT/DnrJ/EryC1/StrS family aminotransferase [Spirochaetales bacterium]|nr:DegT/DnrJ/EryC1/StrS family aminotransferase [Spirochaetales bacterium]